jgi:predicted ribonuclease toxin of YeeF-YezG toxin-antitoxin module
LRDIESYTDLPIPKSQRAELVKHLKGNDHTYAVSKADYDAVKKEYRKLRRQMIKDREANTRQAWPKTDKGVPYQAHHVITERYGGPNTWWNIHPARFPDQHQAGIHRANGATSQVFPHNPIREQ